LNKKNYVNKFSTHTKTYWQVQDKKIKYKSELTGTNLYTGLHFSSGLTNSSFTLYLSNTSHTQGFQITLKEKRILKCW